MSIGNETNGGLLPEDALATALAIADRAAAIELVFGQISSEIQGVPFTPAPLEVRRAAQIGKSTFMLLQLEDPTRTLSFKDLIASSGPEALEYQATQLSEKYGYDIDAGTLERTRQVYMDKVSEDSPRTDEIRTEEFAKQLSASKRLARERGVDVATVYTDDVLYYEASREVDTPQRYVEITKSVINDASEKVLIGTALHIVDNSMPAELKEGLTKEDLDEIALELQLDPDFQAATTEHIGIIQEVTRQTLFYEFIKTYGYDAVNQLSLDQQGVILPQRPLASVVADLIKES